MCTQRRSFYGFCCISFTMGHVFVKQCLLSKEWSCTLWISTMHVTWCSKHIFWKMNSCTFFNYCQIIINLKQIQSTYTMIEMCIQIYIYYMTYNGTVCKRNKWQDVSKLCWWREGKVNPLGNSHTWSINTFEMHNTMAVRNEER